MNLILIFSGISVASAAAEPVMLKVTSFTIPAVNSRPTFPNFSNERKPCEISEAEHFIIYLRIIFFLKTTYQ